MAYVVRMDPLTQSSEPPPGRSEQPAVRPGVAVLAAVLTELVVIGVLGNQWLTEREAHWIVNETHSALARDFKVSLLTFNWRFAPLAQDTQHTWLSQLLLIVTTLVLTAAFTSVVVRGPASFARVAVGCWLAVVGATTIGQYVRGLVNDQPVIRGSRLEKTLFGPLSPSAVSVFASIVLALIVGLVAAAVTVWARNRVSETAGAAVAVAPEAPYVPPEQPPPFFPETPRARPSPSPATLPAPAAAEGATTRFPRPPDDDDLGHVDE